MQDSTSNNERNGSLIGREFTDMSNFEGYTVIGEIDHNYLKVQLSAMKRADLPFGIEVIHRDEIDGETLKWM